MAKTTKHKRSELNAPSHGAVMLNDWFAKNPQTTKVAIGEVLGISKGTIGHLLTCRQQPTTRLAVQLEDACGIPVREWTHVPRKIR